MDLVISDAMILIHSAKIGILDYFPRAFEVKIPPAVFEETVTKGKKGNYPDAILIEKIINEAKIQIVQCNQQYLSKYEVYGLKGGELEAVALYFQLNAEFLASNDDHVRRVSTLLQLNLVSSPELTVHLYMRNFISSKKAIEALNNLKKVGWFHPLVIDRAKQEVIDNE